MNNAGSLKFFSEAKNSISNIFSKSVSTLENFNAYIKDMGMIEDGLLNSDDFKLFESSLDKFKGVLDIVRRKSMKVVFFGRTSNGKSTVVNAMLRSKILPSGLGHTTNCFVQVEGFEGQEAYIMTEDGEKKNVQSLNQLASALSKFRLTSSSLIKIGWPKDQCRLLKDDVIFVDSPGIDLSADVDDWIGKFCLDADVFVLVVNAESTLMQTEKNFFHKVSSRLSKPNIFILNNRWDASAFEPETYNEVHEQHMERSTSFLVNELQVMNVSEVKKRVFFISASEKLSYQINKNIPSINGFEERLEEFSNFEKCFEECISQAAVETKFSHHILNGKLLSNDLTIIWDQVLNNATYIRLEKIKMLSELKNQHLFIGQEMFECSEDFKDKIKLATKELHSKMTSALVNEIQHLHSILDEYTKPFEPDNAEYLNSYKKDLNFHVEENLTKNLHIRYSPIARTMLEDVSHYMIDSVSSFLPDSRKRELYEWTQSQDFELSYHFNCSGLCSEFHEDIEFRFSLGLHVLIGKYVIGMPEKSSSTSQIIKEASQNLIPLAALTSSGSTIGVLVLLTVIGKAVGLRIIGLCFGIYVLLYGYERLTWTIKTKEQTFKRQYIDFVTRQLRLVLDLLSHNSSQQIERELNVLLSYLNRTVASYQDEILKEIDILEASIAKIELVTEKIKAFRNKLHEIDDDLDSFKIMYLLH